MRESPPADQSRTRARHWERIHLEKAPEETSWHERTPELSLEFLRRAGLPAGARVLDVGGGASTLVDHLLELGFRPGVLDVSDAALERSRTRLGARAADVEWFHADVTRWDPPHPWDLWHDRATLHFLMDEADRRAYRSTLLAALAPGGHAVIATFAPDGPERCSGLPVRRHAGADVEALLGPELSLEEEGRHDHVTPSGGVQRFMVCRLRRSPEGTR